LVIVSLSSSSAIYRIFSDSPQVFCQGRKRAKRERESGRERERVTTTITKSWFVVHGVEKRTAAEEPNIVAREKEGKKEELEASSFGRKAFEKPPEQRQQQQKQDMYHQDSSVCQGCT
jgi:hypothetical protein